MHKIILVVGTTPDYIHWIRQSCPGRALFITDPVIRQIAEEDCPDPGEEILVDLSDEFRVFDALDRHLKKWHQIIDGIFSFDCEAMPLTAAIAERWDLSYPSLKTIQNCRDKYGSKLIWESHGIPCPKVSPVNSVSDALAFFHSVSSGCVLKPLTGSGSELVFRCTSELDCRSAFKTIAEGLEKRAGNPLFQQLSSQKHLMLAEELIQGTEYSCDFICENDEIRIIRLAKKIKSPLRPFGTILGYVLPGQLPDFINLDDFDQQLLKSATVLGIKRGICMVDFIVSGKTVQLIEMTPRPGGDCLPYLLKESTGMDILELCLDFAQRYPLEPGRYDQPALPYVGIRLHADKSGTLKGIDSRHLLKDPRVKHILLTKKPGHQITMPPVDYDSWFLGHIIIEPSNDKSPEFQAMMIAKTLNIHIDSYKLFRVFPEAS